ncbi:MAG: hypothetical protein LUQ37_09565 [Methanoregulaceae archaeon]|jgi:hypothetical protein|nr:hypothetical protein [Methanoregulaceae archaeon]
MRYVVVTKDGNRTVYQHMNEQEYRSCYTDYDFWVMVALLAVGVLLLL